MTPFNKKTIVVSKEVHKFIMRKILESDIYSTVDDYLKDKLGV